MNPAFIIQCQKFIPQHYRGNLNKVLNSATEMWSLQIKASNVLIRDLYAAPVVINKYIYTGNEGRIMMLMSS